MMGYTVREMFTLQRSDPQLRQIIQEVLRLKGGPRVSPEQSSESGSPEKPIEDSSMDHQGSGTVGPGPPSELELAQERAARFWTQHCFLSPQKLLFYRPPRSTAPRVTLALPEGSPK